MRLLALAQYGNSPVPTRAHARLEMAKFPLRVSERARARLVQAIGGKITPWRKGSEAGHQLLSHRRRRLVTAPHARLGRTGYFELVGLFA